jgi:ABC-type lipoprotein export system ATPase subunit
MKLHSVRIADYRVLRNFQLEFEDAPEGQTYALDLIVGVNGTGKSTLLRALAAIFRYLERKEMPPFAFEVIYQLRDGSEVTTLSNLKEKLFEQVEDGLLRVSYGLPQNQPSPDKPVAVERLESSELPPLVVAFTTGSEREWALDDTELPVPTNERHKPPNSDDSQFKEQLTEWYLRELPGEPVDEMLEEGETTTTNMFLFITAEQMPLVILCGMLNDMKDAFSSSSSVNAFSWRRLQKAMEEPRIKLLRSFSLKFRMNRDILAPEDQRFTDELRQLAHHTVQTGSDYLLVFDLVKAQPERPGEEIFDKGVGQLIERIGIIELFKRLARLAKPGGRLDPILRDVDLFLEMGQAQQRSDERPPLHLLKWLSDGEQSFLGRLCLISFLGESEALILLDEPEVHFNDKWKRQLVFMLNQSLKEQRSHVLMTTHSSITLSDVQNTSIRVLQRNNGYTSNAIPPNLRTLGADPSDIMVSVFGAENAAGAQSVQYIKDSIDFIKERTSSLEDKRAKIAELEKLLSEVGPGYWRFLIRREIHALESREKR